MKGLSIEKISTYLPSLDIKLELIRNFVRDVYRRGSEFQHIKNKFPKDSKAKVKKGMFVGAQIPQLTNDMEFCFCEQKKR